MLRIGILLDSYVCSAWVATVVENIQASNFGRVELVVMNTPAAPKPKRFSERLKTYWKLGLYNRYEQWDYERNRGPLDAKAPADLSSLLLGVPVVIVHPLRKGFTDLIPDDELGAIRSYDLDVLLRFGFRIIRGGILSSARYGIWSLHHDDNREYRGGPPLFWELYERNPVSGTVLQILTESLDGGHVIYRGLSSTEMMSLYRNRNNVYWKAAEFFTRRLSDLHRYGFDYIQSLPTYSEQVPYTRGIYRTPAAPKMMRFIAGFIYRSIRGRVRARMRGAHPQWFLAIRRRTPQRRFLDATGYTVLTTPSDRFYADPCLFERDCKTYLFLEDFRYAEGRALISYCEIRPDGSPGPILEILRRPYHLSYPFVFEEAGEIYMIPETKGNRTVELYRATHFPEEWQFDRVLLDNIYAVDATIHKSDGKFWMFVGTSNGRYSNSEELSIFYAETLHGPWQPHAFNPVVSDVRSARPAGALFRDSEGRLIRPSQDCSKAYGYATIFSEVVKLSEAEYEEREIGRVDPTWLKGNLGTHTYTRTDRWEVIDGNFPARISAPQTGRASAHSTS
ncbi:MAG TPA: hypothetical protein VHU44_01590 [Acidobacteriaceae bacterium]|jgi:hypothetical protein|nr:hypothetical protein [Acidobacteriaceae bacterium]